MVSDMLMLEYVMALTYHFFSLLVLDNNEQVDIYNQHLSTSEQQYHQQ
jgi:hypothetical protein